MAAGRVAGLLASGLEFGRPQRAGSLTLVPVRHGLPPADYRLFDGSGPVTIEEVPGGGSVPELRVVNDAPHPVLLVEGMVLAGLKQNRTLNVTVLVPAASSVVVPVSCVEQGRWGSMSAKASLEGFHLSPRVRSAKAASTGRNLREGRGYRSDQSLVWHHVADELGKHAAPSPTRSYSDVHRRIGGDVAALVGRLRPEPGQQGVLALAGARPVALDVLDRPDTLAALWGALVGSYAADALRAGGGADDRDVERAVAWVHGLGSGTATVHPAVGSGEVVQVASRNGIASALVVGASVVHLAALPGTGRPVPPPRMARPAARGSWFGAESPASVPPTR